MSRELPLYRALADQLRKDIIDGRHPLGALLPTELDLCVTHRVSRHTAREALRLLTDEGLIERRRGAGTMVIAARPTGPFSQDWGEIGDILQYARDTRLLVQSYGPPDAQTLMDMMLPGNDTWLAVQGLRQRMTGGAPLALTRICVRADLMPERALLDSWPDAIAEYIARHHGVTASRIEQDISAVKLDREQAKLLGEHAGDPALRTLRRYYLADGTPFQASISLHPGDRFAYRMAVGR